jgi:hypothetical protein
MVCKDRYSSLVLFDTFQWGIVKVTKKIWDSYLVENDLATSFYYFLKNNTLLIERITALIFTYSDNTNSCV